jgi:hypothetical protein
MTRPLRLLFACSPLLLAACGEQQVVVYRLAKDTSASRPSPSASAAPTAVPEGMPENHPAVNGAPAAPAMAQTPVATAAGPGLTWTTPLAWQPKPGSAMRKGSYTISSDADATADLAITAFPGDVGGEAANVNRWRGQFGLTPLAAPDAAQAIARIEVNGLKIGIVEVVGASAGAPVRMIGAMVPFGGATWFFKLNGPDDLIARTKPAFLQFLQTVRPATSTP